jgi:threonine 3-dehydrogenase
MPDAITAMLRLNAAPAEKLSRPVYNITAFSPTAGDIRGIVAREFPGARIQFAPDLKRQAIVDSWPEEVDDSAARADWGHAPAYDQGRAFSEYLIPVIKERYQYRG